MNCFPKTNRLVHQTDFDWVYESGEYSTDDVLVVKAARNNLDHSRLGLSISRRVGNAVCRNRWKRLIREAFRLNLDRLPIGLDLVVRPRKGAEADLQAICRSLISLTKRLDKRTRVSARSRPTGES